MINLFRRFCCPQNSSPLSAVCHKTVLGKEGKIQKTFWKKGFFDGVLEINLVSMTFFMYNIWIEREKNSCANDFC